MAESVFTICPRGYGLPSFRTFEAIHNYSIPVYVSDEFMIPYGKDFSEYGVIVRSDEIAILPEILSSFSQYTINQKMKRMEELYWWLCTYEGVKDRIIQTLNLHDASEKYERLKHI
jgi:hypothetical protein